MHRFHLPPEKCGGDALTLENREAHHALRVLRIRVGEEVTVLDGRGTRCLCRIQACGKRIIHLDVLERASEREPDHKLILYQSVLKSKGMDTVIQKATELGASRIVPVGSERAEVRLEGMAAEAKADKWRQIAIESLKQCGGLWLPDIDLPQRLDLCLAQSPQPDLSVVAALHEDQCLPGHRIAEFQNRTGRLPASVGIWIGPEGDFTPHELSFLAEHGVQPVSLGSRILRSETAALYTLAVVSHELQFRRTRPPT